MLADPIQWPWNGEPFRYLDYQKEWECSPHNSVLLYRDICSCGWEISATNMTPDTSIYNACACNSAQVAAFNGSTVISASGPAQIVSTIVIWGHNIPAGTIDATPYGPSNGPRDIGGGLDCPCIVDDCVPIIVDIPIPPENSAVSNIQIFIEVDGPFCIDRIFIGQKLPITFNQIGWANPHYILDSVIEAKRSSCGVIQEECKRVEVPLQLEMNCVPVEWVDQVWRCYLQYAKRAGVFFRWSLNNGPNDIFVGRFNGIQSAPTWADRRMCSMNLNLNLLGNVTQPPCKVKVP